MGREDINTLKKQIILLNKAVKSLKKTNRSEDRVKKSAIAKSYVLTFVTFCCVLLAACIQGSITDTSIDNNHNSSNKINNSTLVQTTTNTESTTTISESVNAILFWSTSIHIEDFEVNSNEEIYTVTLDHSMQQPHDYISKYDKNGNKLLSWEIEGYDVHDISIDPFDNVYVTGKMGGNKTAGNTWVDTLAPAVSWIGPNSILQKFDASGNLLWTRQYAEDFAKDFEVFDTGDINDNHPYCVATDLEGNAYIAGDTSTLWEDKTGGDYQAYIIKYDKDGALVWKTIFGYHDFQNMIDFPRNLQDDSVCSIAVDKNQNVFVTGIKAVSGPFDINEYYYFLNKFDINGNLLWNIEYNKEKVDDVQVDSDGNVYVSRASYNVIDVSLLKQTISKYSPSGVLVWDKRLGIENQKTILELNAPYLSQWLFVDNNNSIYVVDKTDPIGSVIRKYDHDGNELWNHAYNNPDRFQKQCGHFQIIEVNTNGVIYIYGYGLAPFTSVQRDEYFFARLDSTKN